MDCRAPSSSLHPFFLAGNTTENTATEHLMDIPAETPMINSAAISTMESNPAQTYSFTVTTARKLTKLSKASKDRLLKKIEETWKLVEHYIENHVTEESQFREIEKMLDDIRVKLLRMSNSSRSRLPNIKKDRVVKSRSARQNMIFTPKKMQSSFVRNQRLANNRNRPNSRSLI